MTRDDRAGQPGHVVRAVLSSWWPRWSSCRSSGPTHVTALVVLSTVALAARLGRRPGGPSYAHRVGVRGALRHGGRRVPDPRAERVRRPSAARGCSRSGSRATCSLAAEHVLPWLRRPTAAALLGQGGRRTPGHRAHGRRGRRTPPDRSPRLLLVVALALLAESFGRQVWWLWRTRHGEVVDARFDAPLTVLAVLLVWVGLTLPNRVEDLGTSAFVRLPLEALVLVALAVLLPTRARNVTAVAVGVVMALVVIAKTLDMGFYFALNRGFDPVIDWTYAGSLFGLLRDSLSTPCCDRGCSTLAAAAVRGPARPHCRSPCVAWARSWPATSVGSLRTATGPGLVWVLAAALGLGFQAAVAAHGDVRRFGAVRLDQRRRLRVHRGDPDPRPAARPARVRPGRGRGPAAQHPGRPAAHQAARQGRGLRLRGELRPLRGPGLVVLARASTRSSTTAPGGCAPTASTPAARSSPRPTFGAISWLAHSTLQSGLWVDSQQRYDVLMTSQRLTLSTLFERAGWRTVSDSPANTHDWPQGEFYGYDQLYDSRNVGYRGSAVRLPDDARPVHPRRVPPAGAGADATGSR